jgi:hypothetical protein
MLYPLFSYDAMFGSMRILEFPKGSDDLNVKDTTVNSHNTITPIDSR